MFLISSTGYLYWFSYHRQVYRRSCPLLNERNRAKADEKSLAPLHRWTSPSPRLDLKDWVWSSLEAVPCWTRITFTDHIEWDIRILQSQTSHATTENLNIFHQYNFLYPAGTWKALLDCNNSSHTQLAKAFPSAWNKLITEGSHTLTSSVSDLTCNLNERYQN